ncbi:MAG: NAD(P)-dependent oxidoreductase [Gemmatimonadota bacterium]
MRVLVVEAPGGLSGAIAAELATSHEVRLFGASPDLPTGLEGADERLQRGVSRTVGSLLEAADAWQAVRHIDAVVHPGQMPALAPGGDAQVLEWYTRGTHVLLKAAVEAGVRRVVLGSTLDLFGAYPEDVYITEQWRPRPGTGVAQLAPYLAEQVCREFARDYRLTATVLRLGRLVLEEEVAGAPPDLMWLDRRDAARAFAVALQRDHADAVHWTTRWQFLHVCADIPNPRYLIDAMRRTGWVPQHNFAAAWGGPAEAAGR